MYLLEGQYDVMAHMHRLPDLSVFKGPRGTSASAQPCVSRVAAVKGTREISANLNPCGALWGLSGQDETKAETKALLALCKKNDGQSQERQTTGGDAGQHR